jgi:hypothetical protein
MLEPASEREAESVVGEVTVSRILSARLVIPE